MKALPSHPGESELPVVALIGASNVGKSSLFNCLTASRGALVASQAGFTRDRQYGAADCGGYCCLISDTCGLDTSLDQGRAGKAISGGAAQSLQAIDEARLVLLLVDAQGSCGAVERELAGYLRRQGKPTLLVINKVERVDALQAQAEFATLGVGEGQCISALHGRGLGRLRERIAAQLKETQPRQLAASSPQTSAPPAEAQQDEQDQGAHPMSVAVMGRPNVGKSTLVNHLLGAERMVVEDQPGTTRDSVQTLLSKGSRRCLLLDTAGVRRRARTRGAEKLCALRSLERMAQARLTLLLLDAEEGITEQDLRLLARSQESGRVLVLAVNKWDLLDDAARQRLRTNLERRLHAPTRVHYISAHTGSGVEALWGALCQAHDAASRSLRTPQLTRILRQAVAEHPLPAPGRHQIKLRYAHPGGSDPLSVVVHGNQAARLPATYQRYLENYFQRALGLGETPVQLLLRDSDNPYASKPNRLSPRQQAKRARIRRYSSRSR